MQDDYKRHLRRSLQLLPIPLLFVVLGWLGYLEPAQNAAMDWRFAVRGPVETPDVKLIYVNLDQQAIQQWGQFPFPRVVHAETARAVLDMGGASTVFFDFIFSPIASSEMVPMDRLTAADEVLGQVVREHPDRIVLASAYSDILLPVPTVGPGEAAPQSVPAYLPLLRNGTYDPETNPPPEMPGYPIYNALPGGHGFEGERWGRTAFINVAYVRGAGAVLRWLPAYVETHNEHYSRVYLHDLLVSLRRNPGGMALVAPYAAVEAPQGAASFRLAADRIVLGGQVVEMDTEMASVPAVVPRLFNTAAIEIILAAHGLDDSARAIHIAQDRSHLELRDYNNGDALLHRIPLVDGQLVEVNWFSRWITPTAPPPGSLGAMDDAAFEARVAGAQPQVQEALERMRQAELGGLADPYNPRISMFTVVALHRLATASPAARALVEPWLRQHFEGRMVLVGATDPIMQDVGPTPMDRNPVPRVSAHGNALKTILTGNYVRRPPYWVVAAITLVLAAAISELARRSGRGSLWTRLLAGGLLLGYIVAVFAVFIVGNWVLPFVLPVGAAFTTASVGLGLQLLEEERRRTRIKGMFATYLAPELVDRMVESGEEPKLGGHSNVITMLFSDIQNFSTFSEQLRPDELTFLINEYLTPMTRILQGQGAYVDKYIGDAIVAMINDPVPIVDHAHRGCLAAALMQEKQAELRQFWAAQGTRWPQVVSRMRTRIGINTGEATVGNMGSEDRLNYTMMGDDVNLAARCESGAKSVGVYTLVTEATRLEAERCGDDIVFRYIDRWKVKGRSRPVSVFEVMGRREAVDAAALECRDLYEAALRHYFARNFSAAIPLLERAVPLEPFHPDRVPESPTAPSIVLLERCRLLKAAPPPEDWDGVYVMKTK